MIHPDSATPRRPGGLWLDNEPTPLPAAPPLAQRAPRTARALAGLAAILGVAALITAFILLARGHAAYAVAFDMTALAIACAGVSLLAKDASRGRAWHQGAVACALAAASMALTTLTLHLVGWAT